MTIFILIVFSFLASSLHAYAHHSNTEIMKQATGNSTNYKLVGKSQTNDNGSEWQIRFPFRYLSLVAVETFLFEGLSLAYEYKKPPHILTAIKNQV